MSNSALGWAMQQQVGWPLAKLLLVHVGDNSAEWTGTTAYDLQELTDFSGAHDITEVDAALRFLVGKRLLHLELYAPPDVRSDIPIGARTCDPTCGICAVAQRLPRPEPPAWVKARLEWERLRPILMQRLLERDGPVCRKCGATEDLTGDHIVPLRRGGSNDLENLQILCRPCNTRKGARVEA